MMINRTLPLLLLLIGCQLLASVGHTLAAEDEAGFHCIFDGKSLEGWDGNPQFWSVQDGAITGRTTKGNPTKGNTFLIWRAGKLDDFELRLKYRIVGGNSGIQYRSHEIANSKWVIGGYQADMDAAGKYTGILYEERGRGTLAKQAAKVVIGEQGEKKTVGKTASDKQILAAIRKEGWNDYTVIARGNHLLQKLNGITTVDVTDNQASSRAMSGLLALQIHTGPPMMVQFKNIRLKRLNQQSGKVSNKRIIFVAGTKSHGYGAHEHNAGCLLLAQALNQSKLSLEAVVHRNGWPKDPHAFDGADAIVMYCDGGARHFANQNLGQIAQLASRGVGIASIHYGVEVPKGESGDRFLNWIGGYFETGWSVNPYWKPDFKHLPKHPITRGVEPFSIQDEWYYHMRFRPQMEGVTPLLTAAAPPNTLTRPDGPHSGNKYVRAAVDRGLPQHVAWAAQRDDGGRGFGFTGGHFHWNWGNHNFRKLVLNAIVWVARADVPAGGVESRQPTLAQLQTNQDYPQPKDFSRDRIQKMLDAWNNTAAAVK